MSSSVTTMRTIVIVGAGQKKGCPGTLIPGQPYWESVPLLGLSIVF
jgi:hypothetical protein